MCNKNAVLTFTSIKKNSRQNHVLVRSRNLLFIIKTDQCWDNLVGEDKVLDGGGDEDEEEEERDVLDPAPLDDLPEARPVGETLLGISQSGGHREVVTVRPRGPHTVLLRQLYCQISTFNFSTFLFGTICPLTSPRTFPVSLSGGNHPGSPSPAVWETGGTSCPGPCERGAVSG